MLVAEREILFFEHSHERNCLCHEKAAIRNLITLENIQRMFLITSGVATMHWLRLLLKLIHNINVFHPTMIFGAIRSTNVTNFLNVSFSTGDRKVSTSLHRKPSDSRQYLSFKCSHPCRCKTSIPYSRVLRYRRIWPDSEELAQHLPQFKSGFITREYVPTFVNNDTARARTAGLTFVRQPPSDKSNNPVFSCHV